MNRAIFWEHPWQDRSSPKKQWRLQKKFKADAVSHGATGKGNDQVRFEMTYMALAPHLKIIAPWKIWDFKGRKISSSMPKSRRFKVPVTKAKTLFHGQEPPSHQFRRRDSSKTLGTSRQRACLSCPCAGGCPDRPAYVEVEFKQGNPVSVNGERLSPANSSCSAEHPGRKERRGKGGHRGEPLRGDEVQGSLRTPGGTILRVAHQAMESIHHGPRSDAPQGQSCTALCGDDLLRYWFRNRSGQCFRP